jgi:hypothetical protein
MACGGWRLLMFAALVAALSFCAGKIVDFFLRGR